MSMLRAIPIVTLFGGIACTPAPVVVAPPGPASRPAEMSAAVPDERPGPLRAVPLTQHPVRSSIAVPGRPVYVATPSELFVFAEKTTTTGKRVSFRERSATVSFLRTSDFGRIGTLALEADSGYPLVTSADDAYVVIGTQVIATQTLMVAYENPQLDARELRFFGHDLSGPRGVMTHLDAGTVAAGPCAGPSCPHRATIR